jgi:hypothetical protein
VTWSEDEGWSVATRVAVDRRDPTGPSPRRATATFGGGEPAIGRSVRDFVRRYGWRAYALPVLVVLSIAALMTARDNPAPAQHQSNQTAQGPGSPAGGPAPAPASGTSAPVAPDRIALKSDASDGNAALQQAITHAQLPAGGAYTKAGRGTFRVLKGASKPVGPSGPLYRYDIEVENGITGVDLTQFADLVERTLADPRSWSGHGVRLQRVDSGPIDFRVSLTSSMTVRQYCGYDIPVETSCYATAGSSAALTVNRVVLNLARWVRGAAPYLGDLDAYRIYMINHEDGHALGHQHAHQCLPGGLAPVMMQQTFGLKSATDGRLCGANPWPYPPGAKGTPGAEQPDTAQNNEFDITDG